jgi:hypothetical protein
VRTVDKLAAFVHEFAIPFLDGKRCTIADPIGAEAMPALLHGLAVDSPMEEAFERQLQEAALLTNVTPAPFDDDAATLLYATHELFAACHPQASSFYARAHLFCLAAEQAVMRLPRTYDAGRLLTRHLIVRRAFATTRTDVHLDWWTGRASFYGAEPPPRLVSWPSLRRVNVDRKTQPMWRIAMIDGDEETRMARLSLMTALLNLSPLSRLLLLGDPLQKQLGFSLLMPLKRKGRRMSPVYVLDDKRLARAVTDGLLERGVASAGAMLALALLTAVREASPPLVLRRAAELCLHLALSLCLAEGEAPGAACAEPLRQLFDADVKQMNDAVRVYWASVRAAFALDGERLALPRAEDLPPEAQQLYRRMESRLRHEHLAPIADPLARELARRLPPVEREERAA